VLQQLEPEEESFKLDCDSGTGEWHRLGIRGSFISSSCRLWTELVIVSGGVVCVIVVVVVTAGRNASFGWCLSGAENIIWNCLYCSARDDDLVLVVMGGNCIITSLRCSLWATDTAADDELAWNDEAKAFFF
jgi:hypothetical protein